MKYTNIVLVRALNEISDETYTLIFNTHPLNVEKNDWKFWLRMSLSDALNTPIWYMHIQICVIWFSYGFFMKTLSVILNCSKLIFGKNYLNLVNSLHSWIISPEL